ncbi:MAG TPA: glycosyltransferase [bacterium]|nr:glycosyltransferase [bacterium]
MIYSHDTFGLGHFRRCLKLAREFSRQAGDSTTLLMTGSPLAHRFSLPDRADYIKLPAVVKTGVDEYAARSLHADIDDIIRLRASLIETAARQFGPTVLLVDHAPLGLKGEILPTLKRLRKRADVTAVLGLRDVIDEPDWIRAQWRHNGTYEALDALFDRIIVYGHSNIFDTVGEYCLPPSAQYCGYLAGDADPAAEGATVDSDARPYVLVTVGGGEDGRHIVDAFLEMLRRHRGDVGFDTVLLPGPLLPADAIVEIEQCAQGLPVTVRSFVDNVPALMKKASCVVSMGGYNAVAELLAYAQDALIIPRESPRREQLIRAHRLHQMGIVRMLRVSDLTCENLYRATRGILDAPASALDSARRDGHVRTDGAKQAVRIVLESAIAIGKGDGQ